MMRANSRQSPDFFPSLMPFLLPADEMSWQGNPPHSASTAGASCSFVMSSKIGTPGQCLASTLRA
jgi:hypothetical protein